jgi:hypothetical protein
MPENDDANQIAGPFRLGDGAGANSGSDLAGSQMDANSVRARLTKVDITPADLAAAVALVRALADPDRKPDA